MSYVLRPPSIAPDSRPDDYFTEHSQGNWEQGGNHENIYAMFPPSVAPDSRSQYHFTEQSQSSWDQRSYYENGKQLQSEDYVDHDNWKKWAPRRTPALVGWFAFFSFGSVALTLAALFGCYSSATSNLYIACMEPYAILNMTKQYLIDIADLQYTNETYAASIPDQNFFTYPLPWRYQVGISGVCRLYNNSDLSDPSVTSTTICTRQLHPEFDLLHFLEQDIPGGSSSDQFENRRLLLSQATPGLEDSGGVAERSSLVVASSALMILSIIWAVSTAVATIFIKRMYPRAAILSAVADAFMMIGASAMLTIAVSRVANAFQAGSGNSQIGAYAGPGFWVLWAIGFTKLVVTPMMMIAGVIAILTAIWTAFIASLTCLGAMAACLSVCETDRVIVETRVVAV